MNKKTIAIIFLTLMILSMFAGCGSKDTDNDGNVKLTVELFDRNNVPQSEGTLTENRWTEYIHEAMLEQGINIDFQAIPRSGDVQKLIVLLGSNSAPDIIFIYDRIIFKKMANMGGIHDLGPSLEKYGTTLKESLGEEVLSEGVVAGKQYAIPSKRQNLEHYITYIRKDWLDILNLEIPTNRDELLDVLRAFKQNDPGKVGAERIIPYQNENIIDMFKESMKQYDLMYSFVSNSIEEEYKYPVMMRDGFYEFMEYVNTLYKEGLIHKEFATYNPTKNREQCIQGLVGVFDDGARNVGSKSFLGVLQENIPEAELIPIEVYQNADGLYYKNINRPAGQYIMSPVTCDDPDAVIKYLEWMAQYDVSMKLTFGEEGEHYDLVDTAPISKDIDYNTDTLNYIIGDLSIIYSGSPFLSDTQHKTMASLSKDPYAEYKENAAQMALRDGKPEVIFKEEISAESKVLAQMFKVCDEYWIKMVTAEDLPSVYSKFLQELDNMGMEEILSERQAYYDTYVKGK